MHCIFPVDPTFTFENLLQIMDNVKDWDNFHRYTATPRSKYEEIIEQHSESTQWKRALCEWYLENHPGPSWSLIANGLYMIKDFDLLGMLRMHYLQGQLPGWFDMH